MRIILAEDELITRKATAAILEKDGHEVQAYEDGAAALVVAIAGPSRFVVAGEDLEAAARGWRLGRVADGYAWIGAPAE